MGRRQRGRDVPGKWPAAALYVLLTLLPTYLIAHLNGFPPEELKGFEERLRWFDARLNLEI